VTNDDFRMFLAALLDDDQVSAGEASTIEALLSAAQRAHWQRALLLWRCRPPGEADAWFVAAIWPDRDLKQFCQDLILTLLFGLPFENGGPAPTGSLGERAGRHFRGRFWGLAGGHPPGIPGGYYGHWAYPSER